MTYRQLKDKQSKEVHNFPLAFAFNDEQLEKGMRKLGLNPSQLDQISAIGGGGFIRASDVPAWQQMAQRHQIEMQAGIQQDLTGDGFIFQMFYAELANHEYGYSGDPTDALNALGLTYQQVTSNPRLAHGFQKACDRFVIS